MPKDNTTDKEHPRRRGVGYPIVPNIPPPTPDKELGDILAVVFANGVVKGQEMSTPRIATDTLLKAKAAFQKNYISRAEVLKMLKDENFDNNYPSVTEIEVIRNQLRAELRQKLGADHE